jgi:hypothetical protein
MGDPAEAPDERWELIDGQAWSMGPAPATRHQQMCLHLARKLGDKFALYEGHGLAEYWIVDPYSEVIHCWSLDEGGCHAKERLVKRGMRAVSTKLAGFALDTERLFADLL